MMETEHDMFTEAGVKGRPVRIHKGDTHCFREDHNIGREVLFERQRAHDKHDANGGSMERKQWDDPSWLPVLVEEVGEVARALCEYRHLPKARDDQKLHDELRAELIQVMAMCWAWVVALDGGIKG